MSTATASSPYRTLDPATGDLLESFPLATDGEVEDALRRASEGFAAWSARPFEERAVHLSAAAESLEGDAPAYARIMATEMGKPVAQGEGEVQKCAWACRWFAENAEALLAPDRRESNGSAAFVRHDPLGPILAIMPWNFPFWQLWRFAAPALMAGNVVLLKHAPNVPRCAGALAEIGRRAGLPEGVLQSLYLSDAQVAEVLGDRRVRGVTLTGSPGAGRAVASTAGRHLKPMVMELGGSDAFLVLEDADLEEAIAAGVRSRCQNSGQSCIAAKRFLVHRRILDAFTEGFVEGMKAQVMGDPAARDVDIGPLAREDLRATLAEQVARTRSAGARVLCGGEVPRTPGFWYPPTVLAEVPERSPARDEELFGPVAAIVPFADVDEGVRLANDSRYGLGASVWTRDLERAGRLARRLEAGAVFVNGMVKSDPRLPFGGVKDSGFGRELSVEGIRAFVNVKTVWIA